ncbi:MAG: hypothetical protein IJV05_07540 [Muribaculaceae bacterium]|nr:hypothetical protein [Muribaculaceae bacterium]
MTIPQQIKAENGATLNLKNVTVNHNNTETKPAIAIDGASANLDGVKASGSRGLEVANGSTVTVKNSDIAATGSKGYPRGVQLVGTDNKLTIEGSKISAVHYAFNFIGGANNNDIDVTNTTVDTGWAITNIWGNENNVNFEDCVLNSVNDKAYNANGWNNFSALVYNVGDGYIASDNTVTINNSSINVSSTTGNKQSLIGYAGYRNKTIVKNSTVVGTNTNDEPLTLRSYTCDFFDENNQFIGTDAMLQELCNFTDNVTCTWNGVAMNLVEYFVWG